MSHSFSTEPQRLPTGLLIGGEWVRTSSGGTMTHVNPATGKVQAEFPVAGDSEVDDAVSAARRALPAWRGLAPQARATLLQQVAQGMRDRSEELGLLTTLENGTLKAYASAFAQFGASWFDYYAGWTDKLHGANLPFAGALDYTVLEPVGVVGIFLTWNGPTGSIGMKAAAALAAGCTVIIKTPDLAPFTTNVFGEICAAVGIPGGVVNILSGGTDTGYSLVRHPGVDKISFTGGPETARSIQAACAESLTPLVLELGGKSANIVFPDADLERVTAHAVAGICGLQGQVCNAPTRLLVHRSVHDEVLSRVVDLLEATKVGDPFAADSGMGPVISERAADRIMGVIDTAKGEEGLELISGGTRLAGDGYYITPTVFTAASNSSSLAQREVFGPVLAALDFDDEADAVAMANDSAYGLAAYLYTSDLSRAHRMASDLDAGSIGINGGTGLAGPVAPFGGFKQSGYGKEGGIEGILEYTRTKNVNILL